MESNFSIERIWTERIGSDGLESDSGGSMTKISLGSESVGDPVDVEVIDVELHPALEEACHIDKPTEPDQKRSTIALTVGRRGD